LGLGRGASPIEIAGFDVDPANAPAMNREATELILKALTSEVVSYDGKFYRCRNVRIEARPLQQPIRRSGSHRPSLGGRPMQRGSRATW
jgi:alkanesulfonate monooxygenase SsuD/methylene tetrahydromethanopterin reductase-like flavin-dependent oxidoreductase (luciferase family)